MPTAPEEQPLNYAKGKGLPDRKLKRKKLFKLKYSADMTAGPQTSLYSSEPSALRMSFRLDFPTLGNCVAPHWPLPPQSNSTLTLQITAAF